MRLAAMSPAKTIAALLALTSALWFGLRARRLPSNPSPASAAYEAHLSALRQDSSHVDAALARHAFLVIGGTGFTGTVLVEDLVARGARSVRVLSRGKVTGSKQVDGVEYVRGSFTDPAALRLALKGTTVVYQTAAAYGSPSFGMMGEEQAHKTDAINAGGMQALVEACTAEQSSVELLVYTSSCDTVFTGEKALDATEEAPYADKEWSHYTHSKAKAERICLAADGARGGKFRTVALRPNGIIGPGDGTVIKKAVEAPFVMVRRERQEVGLVACVCVCACVWVWVWVRCVVLC
jgi:nucleoside-diphosphate-sugar epimerase